MIKEIVGNTSLAVQLKIILLLYIYYIAIKIGGGAQLDKRENNKPYLV